MVEALLFRLREIDRKFLVLVLLGFVAPRRGFADRAANVRFKLPRLQRFFRNSVLDDEVEVQFCSKFCGTLEAILQVGAPLWALNLPRQISFRDLLEIRAVHILAFAFMSSPQFPCGRILQRKQDQGRRTLLVQQVESKSTVASETISPPPEAGCE